MMSFFLVDGYAFCVCFAVFISEQIYILLTYLVTDKQTETCLTASFPGQPR